MNGAMADFYSVAETPEQCALHGNFTMAPYLTDFAFATNAINPPVLTQRIYFLART